MVCGTIMPRNLSMNNTCKKKTPNVYKFEKKIICYYIYN